MPVEYACVVAETGEIVSNVAALEHVVYIYCRGRKAQMPSCLPFTMWKKADKKVHL